MSTFADRTALLVARNAWCANATAATIAHGTIGTWDVSKVDDLQLVFCAISGFGDCNPDCNLFNDDIDGWDTARVTDLYVTMPSWLLEPHIRSSLPRSCTDHRSVVRVPCAAYLQQCERIRPLSRKLGHGQREGYLRAHNARAHASTSFHSFSFLLISPTPLMYTYRWLSALRPSSITRWTTGTQPRYRASMYVTMLQPLDIACGLRMPSFTGVKPQSSSICIC